MTIAGCSKSESGDDGPTTSPPPADIDPGPQPANTDSKGAQPAKSADAAEPAAPVPGPGPAPKADDPPVEEPPATTGPGPKKATASDELEDIQVLPKSWSMAQVKKYMKSMNRGLGVKCKFCHDTKNFADNSKPYKEVSRDMIKLTMRINKVDFGGKDTVTCFTCHKGKEHIPAK